MNEKAPARLLPAVATCKAGAAEINPIYQRDGNKNRGFWGWYIYRQQARIFCSCVNNMGSGFTKVESETAEKFKVDQCSG